MKTTCYGMICMMASVGCPRGSMAYVMSMQAGVWSTSGRCCPKLRADHRQLSMRMDLVQGPLSQSSIPSAMPQLPRRIRRTSTGGLKNLPIALPAIELSSQAVRIARNFQINQSKVKNSGMRARKLGALRLDILTKSISRPLKENIKAYQYELSVLHPFESTLADLTVRARQKVGHKTLPQVLEAVNELRKDVLVVGKKYVLATKNATHKAEAAQIVEEGFEAISSTLLERADTLLELIAVQKSLRKLPIVQLNIPTMVLVGAPNVGKSSIVRAISSGTPQVNNYPFTTRGMTLGHIRYADWDDHCQVMDTPGVLNRPDAERNEMEALTLSSMRHLPTAVMFVLDLSGQSGRLSSTEHQIQIRNNLRKRFPRRPWIDIVSKCDLAVEDPDFALPMVPEGALRISTVEGIGLPELEAGVRRVYEQLREMWSDFHSGSPPGSD